MKSIGSNPRNDGARGDERIRTAVPGGTNDPEYDKRVTALVLDIRHARDMQAGAYKRGDDYWVGRWQGTHDRALDDLAALARAAVARAGTDNT